MPEQPILIISGTNRLASNSLRLSKIVQSHYERQGITSDLLSLTDLPPALFLPSAYSTKPAEFAEMQERVLKSAGLHVITPEYNGGFPGALKYFIDMLKFPDSFDHRPVAFVGHSNGQFGALRPVEQLQLVFGYRNAHIFPDRVFIASVKDKLDPAGHLKDESLDQRIAKQASNFAKFCDQVRPGAR